MEAESIWISQASVDSRGGNGGTGYVGGDPNYGADGQAGDLELLASVYLQIKESELQVDGIAHIDAPQARISSPILAGDLRLSVGGEMDGAAPDLQVLHPGSNMSVPLDQPLTVVIHTEDSASGVKEVAVSGLGLDDTYPANELIDDRLTLVIARPEPPAMLTVTSPPGSAVPQTGTFIPCCRTRWSVNIEATATDFAAGARVVAQPAKRINSAEIAYRDMIARLSMREPWKCI